MAKVLISEGRIIHVLNGNTVFTALKEVEGEDPFLSEKRKSGFSIIKVSKSQLSGIAQELYQSDDLEVDLDTDNSEHPLNEESLLATQIL